MWSEGWAVMEGLKMLLTLSAAASGVWMLPLSVSIAPVWNQSKPLTVNASPKPLFTSATSKEII